jgi:hypothetical protein
LGAKRSRPLREFALGIEALSASYAMSRCGACMLAEWHRWWKTGGRTELYRLLRIWWDPIGIKDVPEAQGEYTGYFGRLGRLLREGGGEAGLAAFLGDAEWRMGLSGNAELDELVASKILVWYAEAMREA